MIKDTPQAVVTYYGEIQGIVHAFYKESASPKLVVRELSTKALVDCFFTPDMYQAAVETLLEPNAVIFVEGEVSEDRTKNQVASIKVTLVCDGLALTGAQEAAYDGYINSRRMTHINWRSFLAKTRALHQDFLDEAERQRRHIATRGANGTA